MSHLIKANETATSGTTDQMVAVSDSMPSAVQKPATASAA